MYRKESIYSLFDSCISNCYLNHQIQKSIIKHLLIQYCDEFIQVNIRIITGVSNRYDTQTHRCIVGHY